MGKGDLHLFRGSILLTGTVIVSVAASCSSTTVHPNKGGTGGVAGESAASGGVSSVAGSGGTPASGGGGVSSVAGSGGVSGWASGGDGAVGGAGQNLTGGVGGDGTGAAGGAGASGGAGNPGPTVVFATASVGEGVTTNTTTAQFVFASNPAGATEFQCKVDIQALFSDCSSGMSIEDLLAGGHTLQVRAVVGGEPGPIATRSWTVASLPTTIVGIQDGSVPEHTLVTVSTDVRLTGMFTHDLKQYIFVQEAQTTGTIDGDSDIGALAYAGIMTKPATAQIPHAAGYGVTVTGIVREVDNNTELREAQYLWGSAEGAYNDNMVRSGDALNEKLEGAYVRLAGQLPQYNCSSGCANATLFSNSAVCMEMRCNTFSCANPYVVEWWPVGAMTIGVDYTTLHGWVVQHGSRYTFYAIDGEFDVGDDVCL